MSNKAEEVCLLCQHCQRPFSVSQSDAPVEIEGGQRFTLCPKCAKLQGQLVAIQCAACGCLFPRLRSEVKKRQRWCRRAFCPTCPSRPEPAYVKLICSGCGRQFFRRKKCEARAQQRGYKRRYCPLCPNRPKEKGIQQSKPGVVWVCCSHCGREFQRSQSEERKASKRSYKRRLCPICQGPKVVWVVCGRCRKKFPRWYFRVRQKQRLGYRRSVCPACCQSSSNLERR